MEKKKDPGAQVVSVIVVASVFVANSFFGIIGAVLTGAVVGGVSAGILWLVRKRQSAR